MFANNQELFEYIENLIKKLNENNEKTWGEALTNALRISSLPGEVLGQIWLTLKEFNCTEVPKRLKMKKELQLLIVELEKAIKK
jgi:hypothetical protein